MTHFLTINGLKENDFREIFSLTDQIKNSPLDFSKTLENKSIGLLFEKPSLRTRISFEVGIKELGASSIYLSSAEVQLGVRESISDVARVTSGYLDGIVVRTFSQEKLIEFANNSSVPVINALTDLLHPAQILSDIYTIYKHKNDIKKIVST